MPREGGASSNHRSRRDYWVPAFAGTTSECVARSCAHRSKFSNSQRSARRACPARAKTSAIARILGGAGYAVVPFSVSPRGEWSAGRRQGGGAKPPFGQPL